MERTVIDYIVVQQRGSQNIDHAVNPKLAEGYHLLGSIVVDNGWIH